MSENLTSKIYWKDYLANQNIEKDKDSMCIECKRNQFIKNGKITIKCNGITKLEDIFTREELNDLTEEELNEAENVINTYKWAKETFIKENGTPLISERFYQDLIVSCSANRKILRCGRRVRKIIFYGNNDYRGYP